MTEPLITKSSSVEIDDLFSAKQYEEVKKFIIQKKDMISIRLRTRVLVDFLMIANQKSDPTYGPTDLFEAKRLYDCALFVRKNTITADLQGDVNVVQLLEAISQRLIPLKKVSEGGCCKCM
jgi:hypothetical protein